MKNILIAMIAWASLAQVAFAQYGTKSTVSPVAGVVYSAEKATTQKDGDKVLVLLEKPSAPLQAALIKVESKAKFINILAGTEFTDLKPLPRFGDDWILAGKPGIYLVMILESDPKGPPAFKTRKVTLGNPAKPDPIEPEKPAEGIEKHLKTLGHELSKISDPVTAKKLAEIYKGVANRTDLNLAGIRKLAVDSRRSVLLYRNNNIDWRSVITAIDVTFKAANPKTVAEYSKVLNAVADVLQSAKSQSASTKKVCVDDL